MKTKFKLLIPIFLLIVLATHAQKIKIVQGNLTPLKGQKEINTEFTYDNMKVGKFDKEDDYIKEKKGKYNEKEAGKGDRWEKSWKNDRQTRFEPRFIELFSKLSMMNADVKPTAKYTLIFHTIFTEPGFNVGIMRKNALINGEATIVETADHSKVICKLTVDKAPGRTFGGYDFDSGERIQEAYAVAGKGLGKFILSKTK